MLLTQKISLNTWMFFFVVIASVLFLMVDKTGSYMENLEFEYLIFALLILTTIAVNHYFKNVFLEILIFYTIVFFLFRLVVLANANFPSQFAQNNLGPEEVQFSLLLLSFLYFSLAISIIAVNPQVDRKSLTIDSKDEKLVRSIFLFVLFIISMNFYIAVGTGGDTSQLGTASIIFTILSNDNALFLLFVTVVLTPTNMLKKYRIYFIASIVLFILQSLYGGSKAGIFLLMVSLLMCMWALRGPIKISVPQAINSLFVLILAVSVFLVGTYSRMFSVGGLTLTDAIFVGIQQQDAIRGLAYAFTYRIGYFDEFVKFTNTEVYWSYLNLQQYSQAIFDKLSPGINLFNTPYVSRLFHGATKIGVGSYIGIMNSTQMTGFAENYILFGYWVIIPFMMMMFLLRFLTGLCKSFSPISRGLFLTFIVHFFYKWVEGFGYDMLVVNEGIYRLVFFFFVVVFITREVKISSTN